MYAANPLEAISDPGTIQGCSSRWIPSNRSPTAYVATAEPASVNIGLVVGSERALVIDTGSSPQLGRRILAAAREIAGDIPVSHVVVTHYHWDHLFGLAGFDGLTSFGHAAIEDDLRANPQLEAELADLGLTEEDIVLPQNTSNGGLDRPRGRPGRDRALRKGPHISDVVVFIRNAGWSSLATCSSPPTRRRSGRHPPEGLAVHPRRNPWNPARPTVIVPGHGPMMDRESAFIQRAELRFIWEQAEILYKQGVELHEAAKATDSWPGRGFRPLCTAVRVLS